MGLKEYEEHRKRKASERRLMKEDAVSRRRARRAKLKAQREEEDSIENQTGLSKRIQATIESLERAEQPSGEQSPASEEN